MAWFFAGEYKDRPGLLIDVKWTANENTESSICRFVSCVDNDGNTDAVADVQLDVLDWSGIRDFLVRRSTNWFLQRLCLSFSAPSSWLDPSFVVTFPRVNR